MDKGSIMLVEDEALISQDIREILEDLGYDVVGVVDNGSDAIKLAKSSKPDIILMDIAIKGSIDGIKTAEEIHRTQDTPVIYLTSHVDENRLQRAKFSEPYGYIIKPFDEKTLHSTIEMAIYKHKSDSQKQAEKTKVTMLSRDLEMTDNEKNVLYGLIRYPDMNDIELGRILRIKRSTVTAIRNRLIKDGYFTTHRIPDLSMIGCELLTTMNGALKKNLPDIIIKGLMNAPEHIYTLLSKKSLFGMCLAKNFNECKRNHDEFKVNMKNEGIMDELEIRYFPVQFSGHFNFFDYSRYIHKRLGIKNIYEYECIARRKVRELSRNEKRILYAFVRYPSLSDTEIASKTKIPRSSISQARRSFVKDGILKTINIPSCTKLRSELMTHTNLAFDGFMSEPKLRIICDHLRKFVSNIFLIASNTEICLLNTYDDFTEYESEKGVLSKFYKENNIDVVSDEMFTVQNLDFISFEIAPIIKKVLDIDVNF